MDAKCCIFYSFINSTSGPQYDKIGVTWNAWYTNRDSGNYVGVESGFSFYIPFNSTRESFLAALAASVRAEAVAGNFSSTGITPLPTPLIIESGEMIIMPDMVRV